MVATQNSIETTINELNNVQSTNDSLKIYGIHPGSLVNPDEISNLPEVDLFATIYSLNRMVYGMYNSAKMDGKSIDLTEELYAIQFCINQTRKFGVELEELNGELIRRNDSYWSWYGFWVNNFGNNVMDFNLFDYREAKANNQDISKFLPTTSWKDTLEKETKEDEKVLNLKLNKKNSVIPHPPVGTLAYSKYK